jgi:tetratricopeptide (TPR) repeat protein
VINPDSMDLCFQGWAWFHKGYAFDSLGTAHDLFEQATALDPLNVWGLVGIALVDLIVAGVFVPDDRAARLAAAEAALAKALSVAPEDAVAHLCQGMLEIHTNRASQGIRECQRALELNRSLAFAHAEIGNGKIYLGQAEDTDAHIREAMRLSPRDRFIYRWDMISGQAKLYLGKDAEAVTWLRQSIETNTKNPTSHFLLAAALAHLGRLPEARSEAQAGLAIIPTFTISRFRAGASSDNPTAVAGRDRVIVGLRKAGIPEE